MYADDTNLSFSACFPIELQRQMERDLRKLELWLIANKLTLNALKTEYMIIGTRQKIASLIEDVALSIGGISLCKVRHVKCLGVTIDENLTWKKHVDNVIKKVSIGMGLLRRTRNFLTEKQLITIYHSIIEPHFDYCCIVWDSMSDTLANKMQKLQNRAVRIISRADYSVRSTDLLEKFGLPTLDERRKRFKMSMLFKILNNNAPTYLKELFNYNDGAQSFGLRNANLNLSLPSVKTELYQQSFAFSGAKLWNTLPNDLKTETSLKSFKDKLATHQLSVL